MKSFWSVLLTEYSGDEIKNNEMGRACGTCLEEERCVQGYGVEISGKEDTLKT